MKTIICDICKRPMFMGEPGIAVFEPVIVVENKPKFRRFINTGDKEITYFKDIDICDRCIQRIKDEAIKDKGRKRNK